MPDCDCGMSCVDFVYIVTAASLKSCFQYVLSRNDKNLCSKALLSGVRAFGKTDLEAEVERSNHGLHNVQSIQAPVLAQLSSPFPSCMPAQPQRQEKACLSVGVIEKGEPGTNGS